MSDVYEKLYSLLRSPFVFQMQKKQKGQERFGRYHNTEVTFCAAVNVVLFFSYCPLQSQNEIKTTLWWGGQSPCRRGNVLTWEPLKKNCCWCWAEAAQEAFAACLSPAKFELLKIPSSRKAGTLWEWLKGVWCKTGIVWMADNGAWWRKGSYLWFQCDLQAINGFISIVQAGVCFQLRQQPGKCTVPWEIINYLVMDRVN